jgi:hypothetical protein
VPIPSTWGRRRSISRHFTTSQWAICEPRAAPSRPDICFSDQNSDSPLSCISALITLDHLSTHATMPDVPVSPTAPGASASSTNDIAAVTISSSGVEKSGGTRRDEGMGRGLFTFWIRPPARSHAPAFGNHILMAISLISCNPPSLDLSRQARCGENELAAIGRGLGDRKPEHASGRAGGSKK